MATRKKIQNTPAEMDTPVATTARAKKAKPAAQAPAPTPVIAFSENQTPAEKKRRSVEERRQEILAQQAQLQAAMDKKLKDLQEKLARLDRPKRAQQKPLEMERKALPRHVAKLLPDWPIAQVMGALAFARDAVDNNPELAEELTRRGDEFLKSQPRRGRPPKQIAMR